MIVTVNGSEVDVVSNEIKPTFQSNTLNNINNRNLPNATLRFPRTPKNALVFDYLDYQGVNSRVPYTITSVVIRIGNEVILDGTLRITKTTESHYEGMARGKGGDIFDLIKDKKLSDLDFSSYNHYLDNDSYASAVNNTNGYKYALGLFKEEGTESPIDISTQSPLMYKHFLWQLIFNEANIAYTGDIFLDPDYRSELITMAKGGVANGGAFQQEGSYSYNDSTTTTQFYSNFVANHTSIFNPLDTSVNIEDVFSVSDIGEITCLRACKVNIGGRFDAKAQTNSTGALSLTSTVEIKKNGLVIYDSTDSDTATDSNPYTCHIVRTVDHFTFLEIGDVVTMNINSDATTTSFPTGTILMKNIFDIVSISVVQPYVDFNYLIGDMTQTEFIKDIINQYGLLFQVTKLVDGQLSYDFKPMEEILTDKEGAEDWSEKLSRRISTSTSIGSYGIENEFKYKYHTDAREILTSLA
mgnify:FL=1